MYLSMYLIIETRSVVILSSSLNKPPCCYTTPSIIYTYPSGPNSIVSNKAIVTWYHFKKKSAVKDFYHHTKAQIVLICFSFCC